MRAGREAQQILDRHAPTAAEQDQCPIRELVPPLEGCGQRDGTARLEHYLEFLEREAHRSAHRAVIDRDAAGDQVLSRLERYGAWGDGLHRVTNGLGSTNV